MKKCVSNGSKVLKYLATELNPDCLSLHETVCQCFWKEYMVNFITLNCSV